MNPHGCSCDEFRVFGQGGTTLSIAIKRRQVLVLGLAGLAATVVAIGAVYVPVGSPDGFPSSPTLTAHAHETETFDDPASLAAGSDLVVAATVQGSAPGGVRGEEEESDAGALTDRIVTLRVSQVFLSGSDTKPAVGDEIQILEGFWDGEKEGIAMNGVPWSPDEAEGIFFLHKMDGEDLYRSTTSYGRLLYNVPAEMAGPSGEHSDTDGPWRAVPAENLRTIDEAYKYVTEVVRSLR